MGATKKTKKKKTKKSPTKAPKKAAAARAELALDSEASTTRQQEAPVDAERRDLADPSKAVGSESVTAVPEPRVPNVADKRRSMRLSELRVTTHDDVHPPSEGTLSGSPNLVTASRTAVSLPSAAVARLSGTTPPRTSRLASASDPSIAQSGSDHAASSSAPNLPINKRVGSQDRTTSSTWLARGTGPSNGFGTHKKREKKRGEARALADEDIGQQL